MADKGSNLLDECAAECWRYFSCLEMYSEKFFNVYFYEQMFFEIFVAKGDTVF